MRGMTLLRGVSVALLACGLTGAANAETVTIGQLADYSGGTADVGVPFGQGLIDGMAWANKRGGVTVELDTVDYGYKVPRAVAQYKKWTGGDTKMPAILGWGTADTEALAGFIANDKIPYMSASYSAALTDPTGQSGKAKAAPYNFFYAPSYSDALRAMLTWAAQDWKAKGKPGKPKFVHMGANHPYPNAPKEAGEAIAKDLGFEVLPPIQFALTPGDYTAQCLTLKNAGANYAYLGNTAGSNIAVLKACKNVGADVQFLGNVWGMDENAAKAAGEAADGVVFPLRSAIPFNGAAPDARICRRFPRIPTRPGRLPSCPLCRRRMHRALHERGDRLGGEAWRHHRRKRQERILSEEGLGAGRHGGRVQAFDLDRNRSPAHAQYRSLSHSRQRCDRCSAPRSHQEWHHQARKGRDDRPAAQAGMARLVRA